MDLLRDAKNSYQCRFSHRDSFNGYNKEEEENGQDQESFCGTALASDES
jgi:hypothetical protein